MNGRRKPPRRPKRQSGCIAIRPATSCRTGIPSPSSRTWKLKGSAGVIKMGTKVKNIRLVDSDHDIDCKIDGLGAMSLKSEFVKKV